MTNTANAAELTEKVLLTGIGSADNTVLSAYLLENTDIDPSLHGIGKQALDRANADALDKQVLDSKTTVNEKTLVLSEIAGLQRARRDLGIIRMSVRQRILTALSGMNMHAADLLVKADCLVSVR